MNNQEFDKKIRELMEVHTEVPPVGSWDMIESSLIHKAKPKKIFFRRGFYSSVAVAASLLLLLMLNKTSYNSSDSVKVVAQEEVVANVVIQHPQIDKEQYIEEVVHYIKDVNHSKLLGQIKLEEKIAVINEALIEQKEETLVERIEEVTEESKVERVEIEKQIDKTTNTTRFLYPPVEDYRKVYRKKNSPKVGFATNLSPSTGSNSVSLMAMSQANNGLAPNDVVPTIQKAAVPQEVISNTKFLMPLSVGVQVQMPLSKSLSVGLGLNYTMLFSHYDALSRQETREMQQTLHYIGMPLNMYVNIMQKDNVRLYAIGGVTLEKGLYAFYRVSENGVRRTHGKSIDGMQWSAIGGLGIEIAASDYAGVYFDPSVAYYFDNNQPLSIRTSQPLQFKFELGFRFHL